MTVALFVPFVVAALWWIWRGCTTDVYPGAPPLLVVAWQLAALSLIRGPEQLSSGSIPVRVGLLTVAIVVVGVYSWRSGSRIGVIRWAVFYSIVLTVAMALSSAPTVSLYRTSRTILLLVVFSQTAANLDLAVLRRLFGEFMAACALSIAVGVVFIPSQAFQPIKAPVIQAVLFAPLGQGRAFVGVTGLCLLGFALRNRSTGILAWLAGSAALIMLALQPTRASWLAAAVVGLVWLILHNRRHFTLGLIILGIIVSIGLSVDSVRSLWDREQARPVAANILTIRSGIFDAGMDRFMERPIIGDGLGVGNAELLIDAGQKGFTWSSHDELSATLAATGLLGLVAVLWAHTAGALGSLRAWRNRTDPYPIMVAAASFAVTPFWHLIQEPSFVSLPYLAIVLPEFSKKYVRAFRTEA